MKNKVLFFLQGVNGENGQETNRFPTREFKDKNFPFFLFYSSFSSFDKNSY